MPSKTGLGSVMDDVRDAAVRAFAGSPDAASPDALALLERDHDEGKALFAQADALSDTAHASRAKLFKEIDARLTLHTQVEERIFYPALKAKTKRNSDERDEVLEAYEEHAAAKELIAKLERLDPSDETYKAKLQVLGEMVRHHIDEEQRVMFRQARALLSETELEDLGAKIKAAKAQATAGARGAASRPARGSRAAKSPRQPAAQRRAR